MADVGITKEVALEKLPKSYQVFLDKEKLEKQIANIYAQIKRNQTDPVGMQGKLRWILPIAALVLIYVMLSSIMGDFAGILGLVAAFFTYQFTSGAKIKKLRAEQNVGLEKTANSAKNALASYLSTDEYREASTYLVPEYQNSWGVAALFNLLATGRADTWKEALNGLDQRNFQNQVLNNQREGLALKRQEIQAAEANNIMLNRINSGISAQIAATTAQTVAIMKGNQNTSQIASNTSELASDVHKIKNKFIK